MRALACATIEGRRLIGRRLHARGAWLARRGRGAVHRIKLCSLRSKDPLYGILEMTNHIGKKLLWVDFTRIILII